MAESAARARGAAVALIAATALSALWASPLPAEEPGEGDSAARPSAGPVGSDGVAGRVNGAAITFREVKSRMLPALRRAEAEKQRLQAADKWGEREQAAYAEMQRRLFEEALASLVVEKLALQEAERLGVGISEEYVEQRVQSIIKSAGGPAEFAKKYATNPSALREMMRNRLRSQVAQRRSWPSRADPTPAEVRNYYKTHADEFVKPEIYKLRVITIHKTTVDAATGGEIEKPGAREQAEKAAAEAKADGSRFAELARQYSDDARTAQGGGLLVSSSGKDFITVFDVAEPLRKAVAETEPGAVAGPIEAQGSFSIIKMEERRASGVISLGEAQVSIERKLADQMFIKAQREWISHLLAQASVTDTFGRPLPRDMIMKTMDETGQDSPEGPEAPDTQAPAPPAPAEQDTKQPAPETERERPVGGIGEDG